jgi:hypothetical protein
MDCRICGDPNSAMRFAFIEFAEDAAAQKVCARAPRARRAPARAFSLVLSTAAPRLRACSRSLRHGPTPPAPPRADQALTKTGAVLGNSSLRVLPSKTAIVPVNKDLMPRTNDELERCSRTVYVANIDKKVDKDDVRSFFEQLCGEPPPPPPPPRRPAAGARPPPPPRAPRKGPRARAAAAVAAAAPPGWGCGAGRSRPVLTGPVPRPPLPSLPAPPLRACRQGEQDPAAGRLCPLHAHRLHRVCPGGGRDGGAQLQRRAAG